MRIRPPNRFERQDRAVAQAMTVAMPPGLLLLSMLIATAIAAEEWVLHFIAAGTRLLTPTGARPTRGGKRRLASGTNDGCCCCPDCTKCSDSSPDSFTVTYSGITNCWVGCCVCSGRILEGEII